MNNVFVDERELRFSVVNYYFHSLNYIIHIELSQSNLVVSQFYDTDVNKAYVIRGNAAILKCEIPSFVADFVSAVSWHTDQDETFYPSEQYGWLVCQHFNCIMYIYF